MKAISWILVPLLAVTACDFGKRKASGPTPVAVTYHHDIKPLIDARCSGCHVDGGIGFSLTSADSVLEKRSAVVAAVETRRMPVWMAASGHQTYRDDPSLSESEIELFRRWRDGGYIEGAPEADLTPAAPMTRDLAPDVTLPVMSDGAPYLPDQNRADIYRCFPVEWPRQDRPQYMTGFQAIPGNAEIVHHLVAYRVSHAVGAMVKRLDQEEDGPGYDCFTGAMPDRLGDPAVYERMEAEFPGVLDNRFPSQWLGHWAPGMRGNVFPEGTGVLIPADSMVIVQIHFYTRTAPGTADDGSEIRLTLADDVAKPALIIPISNDDWLRSRKNRSQVIPPGQEATFAYSMPMTEVIAWAKMITGFKEVSNVELHSSNLHMHAFGKGASASLVTDGKAEVLLEIPKWNLNWQRDFTLSTPKLIAAGMFARTEMAISCSYANPTDKEVFGGFGSYDEMCFNFAFFAFEGTR